MHKYFVCKQHTPCHSYARVAVRTDKEITVMTTSIVELPKSLMTAAGES